MSSIDDMMNDLGGPCYDRTGNRINVREWGKLREDDAYIRVALDELRGGTRISTVWLGIDHGFGGVPLIFETMAFGGRMDGECWRYSMLEEAAAGHERMVEECERMMREVN